MWPLQHRLWETALVTLNDRSILLNKDTWAERKSFMQHSKSVNVSPGASEQCRPWCRRKTCSSSSAEVCTDQHFLGCGGWWSYSRYLTAAPGRAALSPLWLNAWCLSLIFTSPFNLLTWQKMTFPPHPQVDLLQFESWVGSEVSGEQQSQYKRSGEGTWRWASSTNFGLQMSYKHKGLKEVNKTNNW